MPENHMDNLYNSSNVFVRFVHLGRLKAIHTLIPQGSQLHLLDAGCGEGHLIERLHQTYPDYHYFGLDITEIALEKAKRRCPYAKIIRNDLTSLPFENNFFDVVVCTEVLEHIEDYKRVLQEFSRVLKPGGSFIITFPNENLWSAARLVLGRRPIKVPDHIHKFSPNIIKDTIFYMKFVQHQKLPFDLPFILSLGHIMKFVK